jgi:DNA topoisomerase-1
VRELKKLPGRDLFEYVGADGAVVNIRRRHINGYIKEVMGERFSAKDFRTWAGTLIAA